MWQYLVVADTAKVRKSKTPPKLSPEKINRAIKPWKAPNIWTHMFQWTLLRDDVHLRERAM